MNWNHHRKHSPISEGAADQDFEMEVMLRRFNIKITTLHSSIPF
jgi:hypothetical protein